MLCWLAGLLLLSGCVMLQAYENPYRVDSVIQIPVDPTDTPTAPASPQTEPEEQTEEPTEVTEPAEEETVSATKPDSGSKTSTSSKTSSGSKTAAGSSSKTTEPVQAQSEETVPPETEPEQTLPPETEPPTEPPTVLAYDPSGYTVGSLEYAVLEQINAYRAEAGVAALSMDTSLCKVASVRAFEISALWSHTRPDGRDYSTVLSDYGYGCGTTAENLTYMSGDGDAAAMVARWMRSESSKSSLLSESFTTAGIGIYASGGVTYLANLLIG